MPEIKEYIGNFLLAGLFLISIITGAILLAGNYNYDEGLMSSDKIDTTGLEEQLRETSGKAEQWGETFKSDNPLFAGGYFVLTSIWGISKLIWNSVVLIFNIIFQGAINVLGVPPIVIGVIFAIMIIGLIFAIWKMLRQGE